MSNVSRYLGLVTGLAMANLPNRPERQKEIVKKKPTKRKNKQSRLSRRKNR